MPDSPQPHASAAATIADTMWSTPTVRERKQSAISPVIVATTRRGDASPMIRARAAGSRCHSRHIANGSLCVQPQPSAALRLAPPTSSASTSGRGRSGWDIFGE